jgi:hypothetical protein
VQHVALLQKLTSVEGDWKQALTLRENESCGKTLRVSTVQAAFGEAKR